MDDAPFEKHQAAPVPVVGVVMEGPDRIESVALGGFPVDGEDATGYLAQWIGALRARPTLQGVILGEITIAGLALVDVAALAAGLGLPGWCYPRSPSRVCRSRCGSPTSSAKPSCSGSRADGSRAAPRSRVQAFTANRITSGFTSRSKSR